LGKDNTFSDLFDRPNFTWPNKHLIADSLTNKTVLVTGAGGSIGSALCLYIASLSPRKLILLGRGEHSLYTVQRRLLTYLGVDFDLALADIQNPQQIEHVFELHNPEFVFHTAAYKHVNMLERFPCQAVLNNVMGTLNVMYASQHAGAERFVSISTDKAVEPTGILGATKKLCECILYNQASQSRTDLISVRFGNVFRSSGNVVASFEQQAKKEARLTITDPNAQRFFMDIENAVQTVLSAAKEAQNGEVAILDMGDPITIRALADALVESLGLKSHEEVKYDYIGLQSGEKLIEKLYTEAEAGTMRRVGSMMYTKTDMSGFSYDESVVETLIECARTQDDAKIRSLLAACVPGYTPAGNE
jgi:FlaA1/EpsC-like NDP-sugar epimerase